MKIELQFFQWQHQYYHHFHIPHPMMMLKEIYMDLLFVHVVDDDDDNVCAGFVPLDIGHAIAVVYC